MSDEFKKYEITLRIRETKDGAIFFGPSTTSRETPINCFEFLGLLQAFIIDYTTIAMKTKG